MKSTLFRFCSLMLLSLVLWGGGMWIRRAVLKQQTVTLQGEEAPFLMESALQFRMTRMVHETGTLPEIDDKVQVPDGVNMRETYSVGAEWVYVFLSRALPEDWTLVAKLRWVSTGVFCLSIPFAALWVWVKYGSWLGAAATGGLLAVSPAFSVRSSGLELSRENLAIPFITLFFLAGALAKKANRPGSRVAWALLAAFAAGASQCVWDLTQYVIGLWVAWSWICKWREPAEEDGERELLISVTPVLILCSIFNPYLRAHAFFFSPVMAFVVARALSLVPVKMFSSRRILILLPLLCWGLWWGLGHFFVENYSHFGELLWAKLRFLNQKPEDPALLTYAQRIMWTPALNSATWALTKAYLLLSLCVFGIAVLMLIRGLKKGRLHLQSEFMYAGVTLPLYVLFFRFHVFLILFAAVCIGAAFSFRVPRRGFWMRHGLPSLFLILFLWGERYLLLFFEPTSAPSARAEQQQILQMVKALGGDVNAARGNRWGRPGAGYGYLDSLADEVRALPDPGPVLANFGISASILAETERAIVLHPKFETPGIRERVRQFYEHLFLKTEKEFRDWAASYGAVYYIHSNGNLSDADIPNSPRYMVDAVEPPPHAPVFVLEQEPQDAVWFRPVYSNPRYRIYRIVLPLDEEWAERMTRLAMMALEAGDLDTARRRSMQALSYHWKFEPAKQVLTEVIRASNQ
ncbi:MAG: hypothetical protein WD708_00740 [Kiritimatiellia bacterium]